MASYYCDESRKDGLCSLKAEVSFMVDDESSQSSGFDSSYSNSSTCSDSSSTSCSDNLYITTGPTNFTVFQMNKSPEIPSSYCNDLLEHERKAAERCQSSLNNNNLRTKPLGTRTPLKDITLSVHSRTNIIPECSPISTKPNRCDVNISRKRSFRCHVSEEVEKRDKLSYKRLRPSFHCSHSTGELERSPSNKYSLEIVNGVRPRSSDIAFGRIESKVLAELIKNLGEEFYERYIIVDCRYPFEYDGGHIKGAINLFDPIELRSTFYPSSEEDQFKIHSKTPIFYCEYSSVRGPNMANSLRELDRQLNHSRYPYIDYQEIYVLSQGYRHFFKNADLGKYCEPECYIPMKSKSHAKEVQKYSFHQKSVSMSYSLRSRSNQPKSSCANKAAVVPKKSVKRIILPPPLPFSLSDAATYHAKPSV